MADRDIQASLGSRPPKNKQIVRLKTGCLTCRRRKVKCGEEKPECRRCRKENRQCIGLNYGSDSRATTIAIASAHTTNPALIELNNRARTSVLCRSPNLLGYHSTSNTVSKLIEICPKLTNRLLWKENNVANSQMWIIERFVRYLPCRSGRFAHLDAATMCLTARIELLMIESSPQQESQRVETLKSYQIALRRLKRVLNDPKDSFLPETLLAATLLCCYEAFDGSENNALAQHLYGLGKIFEHHGATRTRVDLDFELLATHLSSIPYVEFKRHMPCVFGQKQWTVQVRYILLQQPRSGRNVRMSLAISCASIYQLILDCTAIIKSEEYSGRELLINELLEEGKIFAQLHGDLIETATIQGNLKAAWYRQYIGGSHSIHIMYSRLLVALNADNAYLIEEHLQERATDLKRTQIYRDANYSATEVELKVTHAALATAEEWLEFAATGSENRLIAPDIYLRWLRLMGVEV